MLEIILWIILSMSLCTALVIVFRKEGGWIVFSVVSGLGVLANVLASAKVLAFPFGMSVPAGIIAYTLTFFLIDYLAEKKGPALARKAVYGSLAAQAVAVFIIYITLQWPAASFMSKQQVDSFSASFNLSPRLFLAGFIAFSIASLLNIAVFVLVREKTGPKMLWLRSKASAITAIITANLIFIPLGYYGTGFPLLSMMCSHAIVQVAVAIIDTVFLYLLVNYGGLTDDKARMA